MNPKLHALTPHPESPAPAGIHGVRAGLWRREDGRVVLQYHVDGNPAALRIPPAEPCGRSDGLWQHTCFECFIRPQGGAGYGELNLAPSGRWAAYQFSEYRKARLPHPVAPMESLECQPHAGGLQLDAVVRLTDWIELANAERLLVSLTAVLESSEGVLSYWALRHPLATPDFHHADGFVLELESVSNQPSIGAPVP